MRRASACVPNVCLEAEFAAREFAQSVLIAAVS
jgi:hypothetical protein